jgi:hypothetical protein
MLIKEGEEAFVLARFFLQPQFACTLAAAAQLPPPMTFHFTIPHVFQRSRIDQEQNR